MLGKVGHVLLAAKKKMKIRPILITHEESQLPKESYRYKLNSFEWCFEAT